MAGARKDSRLQTRTARANLKEDHHPHWINIAEGVALGYRRGPTSAAWYVRAYAGDKKYHQAVLGIADDHLDANGETILTFFQAQEKARNLAKAHDKANGIGIAQDLTVAEAAAQYLAWYGEHRKALTTTTNTVQAHILPAFGNKRISDLKARDIKTWMESLARTPARKRGKIGAPPSHRAAAKTELEKRARKATANRILTVLKAILNKAFHDELVGDDTAWRSVKPFPQADEPIIRFLTEAEATRLVNAARVDFRPLVKAALFTGARVGELTALEVSDFETETKSIYIRPSKSGRGQHIPLNPEGYDFFRRLTAGRKTDEKIIVRAGSKAWGKNHHVRPLAEACKAARIAPAISFHELRHTYASTLAQLGVELLTLSKLLGHADTRITSRHYAHLTDLTLHAAVAKLPGFGHKKDGKVARIR